MKKNEDMFKFVNTVTYLHSLISFSYIYIYIYINIYFANKSKNGQEWSKYGK